MIKLRFFLPLFPVPLLAAPQCLRHVGPVNDPIRFSVSGTSRGSPFLESSRRMKFSARLTLPTVRPVSSPLRHPKPNSNSTKHLRCTPLHHGRLLADVPRRSVSEFLLVLLG